MKENISDPFAGAHDPKILDPTGDFAAVRGELFVEGSSQEHGVSKPGLSKYE